MASCLKPSFQLLQSPHPTHPPHVANAFRPGLPRHLASASPLKPIVRSENKSAVSYFRCGMPFKSHSRILFRSCPPVIGHLNACGQSIFHHYLNKIGLASMAFSTNSFSTEAALNNLTSAAIRLATASGRR